MIVEVLDFSTEETDFTAKSAKVKERPKSHFRKPTASVCHVTPRCEYALFLQDFFHFVFIFVCDDWQNRATCLHQVLREAW
jgi:hypothetical protein